MKHPDQADNGNHQTEVVNNDVHDMEHVPDGGERGPVRGRGSLGHQGHSRSGTEESQGISNRIDNPNGNDTSTDNAPRLKSVVVAMTDTDNEPGGDKNVGSKRPAGDGHVLDQRPDMKKRNRRLFGSLLGTLKKAREEEDRIQGTDAAQRRAAALKEAERKSHEASSAAQAAAVSTAAGRNIREQGRLASRVEGREVVHNGNREGQRRLIADALLLSTVTLPVVRWAPRIECEEVTKLREKQQQQQQEVVAAPEIAGE